MITNSIWYQFFKSIRPRQWIKNFALYAALLFSGFFFFNPVDGPPLFLTVSYAIFVFSILTSSVYLINDIIDVEADKKHPFKNKRPIASGKFPIPIAIFAAISGLIAVFFLSSFFTPFFRLLCLIYLVLQVSYSTKLKHYPIWDVIAIASGFLVRVYAGAVVVNLHMSVWFLLTVVSASLFLAVGKRQSERTLLGANVTGETRKTLSRYSQRLLDQYTGMFANATWLTYALFAFQDNGQISSPAFERFPNLYTFLPRALQSQKLLMLTLPFVIFGVMRYLHLVYEDNQGESPEKVLLGDKALLTTVFSFGAVALLVIYL